MDQHDWREERDYGPIAFVAVLTAMISAIVALSTSFHILLLAAVGVPAIVVLFSVWSIVYYRNKSKRDKSFLNSEEFRAEEKFLKNRKMKLKIDLEVSIKNSDKEKAEECEREISVVERKLEELGRYGKTEGKMPKKEKKKLKSNKK